MTVLLVNFATVPVDNEPEIDPGQSGGEWVGGSVPRRWSDAPEWQQAVPREGCLRQPDARRVSATQDRHSGKSRDDGKVALCKLKFDVNRLPNPAGESGARKQTTAPVLFLLRRPTLPFHCHPERSEGPASGFGRVVVRKQIPQFVRDDRGGVPDGANRFGFL